jgi:nitrate reductase gamma subunit
MHKKSRLSAVMYIIIFLILGIAILKISIPSRSSSAYYGESVENWQAIAAGVTCVVMSLCGIIALIIKNRK